MSYFVVSTGDVVFALSTSSLTEVANSLTPAHASALLQRRRSGRMRIDQWLAARRIHVARRKATDIHRSTSSDSDNKKEEGRHRTPLPLPPISAMWSKQWFFHHWADYNTVKVYDAARCSFQIPLTTRSSRCPIQETIHITANVINTGLYPPKSGKAGEWRSYFTHHSRLCFQGHKYHIQAVDYFSV